MKLKTHPNPAIFLSRSGVPFRGIGDFAMNELRKSSRYRRDVFLLWYMEGCSRNRIKDRCAAGVKIPGFVFG